MAGRGRRLRWAAEYALLGSLYAASRLCPERCLRRGGRLLGRLVHDLTGYRRAVVLENLAHAFPQWTAEQREELARRCYVQLGETLAEFILLARWSPERIRALVRFPSDDPLGRLRAEGRGALLTTGHFGNWELLGAAANAHGYPLSVVVRTQSNPWVDRLQNRIRERAGMRVIRADASVREVIRAVRRGEFVAMLPDVNAGDDGVFVDFLGRPASTPRGLAYFAWKLRCPVVAAYLVRREDGTHEAEFAPLIEPVDEPDEAKAVAGLTQRITDLLADAVRRRPDHYYWVHRRWKTRPPAPSRASTREVETA